MTAQDNVNLLARAIVNRWAFGAESIDELVPLIEQLEVNLNSIEE